ncbi:4-phosphoerythronate dehydrogenase [Marinimicrobium agarilyticum]|uniref:4-phosphoerythronate dehydrogenase n=1 Tax=Marinimicrobium agarilyticum TaxID=306546 RepID=UPI0004133482|nr:4-phosphoerythronate dehydrogenase [Marinimicrobium agarilyticum]
MRIVVDENIPLVEECFGDLGEIVRLPGREMTNEDLRGADALLVRSVTQVNAELLRSTPVRFVGTCTIGIDHLDTAYLENQGITWASAPGCNANSVVEYVYAALAHLNTDWAGKRVGIIGCGNVGGRLYRRLKAQGVECRVYDPFLSTEQIPDLTSLTDVLGSDIVCMHTPLTRSGPHPSFHLVGAAQLRKLKPGAVLLNAGRGPVIDNQALLKHLESGADLKVVLDVWEPEPDISRPLLQRVALGSPHIAGYSYDGKMQGTFMIYEALCRHLGRSPEKDLNALRPSVADPERRWAGGEPWPAIQRLIPEVYDITEDDHQLRALAERAEQAQADFAKGFDRLRKEYPKRRECGNYRVTGDVSEDAQARLEALGFRVQ